MREIGEGTEIEQTKDRQVLKVWCEGKEAKKLILEMRREWEEKEIITVEEWLIIAERRARMNAVDEIQEIG